MNELRRTGPCDFCPREDEVVITRSREYREDGEPKYWCAACRVAEGRRRRAKERAEAYPVVEHFKEAGLFTRGDDQPKVIVDLSRVKRRRKSLRLFVKYVEGLMQLPRDVMRERLAADRKFHDFLILEELGLLPAAVSDVSVNGEQNAESHVHVHQLAAGENGERDSDETDS